MLIRVWKPINRSITAGFKSHAHLDWFQTNIVYDECAIMSKQYLINFNHWLVETKFRAAVTQEYQQEFQLP